MDGDGKQHTVNIADESFATQRPDNSNSGDYEIVHSKPEVERKPKRNNFQKEIKEDIKSLWVTVSQLKEFILTEKKAKKAPTTQKETTWNNDSVTSSDMISENEIISKGSPQKNNNNQRTHSRSSGKLKDTLITQFLKPVDKDESDIQLERLRKMHELESRCRRLEKEKALLQKELAELRKKVNNKSMITNRTKMETNGQEGQAPSQAEMKSKRKEQQKPKKQEQQHQPPNVQQQANRPKPAKAKPQQPKKPDSNTDAASLADKKDKQGYTAVYKPGMTVVVGDSLLKNLKGWMMARDGKIKINSFPGATTQDMHHYLKPLLARKPDHVILHCGTNNLTNSLDAEDVANKIIELGRNIADTGTRCSILMLISRRDELEFMVRNVNSCLAKNMPPDISTIDNRNISNNYHLTSSGLHLNRKGDGALALNIIKHVKAHPVSVAKK